MTIKWRCLSWWLQFIVHLLGNSLSPCCYLQAESDCDDLTTDQAIQAKMKNAFVSQNVSSLQELGEHFQQFGQSSLLSWCYLVAPSLHPH